MIKKMLLCFLCLFLFLSIPVCKKKLPTSPDISEVTLPTIQSFTANPTSIASGESSVLSWSTTNATAVSINQGVGNVSATGTAEVSPEEMTTYTLTATNSDGNTTQSCTIEVVLNLPIIDYFTANPTSILAGEWSTLSWSVQPEGLTEALRIEPLGNLTIPFIGVHPVSPAETTTYTLIATNNDGQTTSSCMVSVTAQASITVYITKTGGKYHRSSCSYLRMSKIPISLKDACARGYTPCSRCNPPRCK